MLWSMGPLVFACLVLAGLVGMCSFQGRGPTAGQVPHYDAAAALKADAETLGFPIRMPALPAGWKRDFLLKVDGWAKDRDANTAHSQSVEPLPFHKMTQYPYGPSEHYPDDADHLLYRQKYNNRPALRLIRPLVGDRTTPPRPKTMGMAMGSGAGDDD